MSTTKRNNEKLFKLVLLAIFTAIVIVVQFVGSGIKVGAVSFSLVLIPIVVGGIIIGPKAGAWLGFVFGAITFIGGLTGADAFTAILIQSGIKGAIITALICFGKATAAGLVAGIIYKVLKNKNRFVAVVLSAAAAPIVNTGLFIFGALLLSDVLTQNFLQDGTTVIYFLVIVCAGINFIVEFLVNVVLSPAIYYFTSAITKGRLK